jgi:hypothetical protein
LTRHAPSTTISFSPSTPSWTEEVVALALGSVVLALALLYEQQAVQGRLTQTLKRAFVLNQNAA